MISETFDALLTMTDDENTTTDRWAPWLEDQKSYDTLILSVAPGFSSVYALIILYCLWTPVSAQAQTLRSVNTLDPLVVALEGISAFMRMVKRRREHIWLNLLLQRD